MLALLDRPHLTLCLHDMAGSASPRIAVGGFAYLRFHGSAARHGGRHGDDVLGDWAAWLAAADEGGRATFAYVNNDVGGDAPRDAMRLRHLPARLRPASIVLDR